MRNVSSSLLLLLRLRKLLLLLPAGGLLLLLLYLLKGRLLSWYLNRLLWLYNLWWRLRDWMRGYGPSLLLGIRLFDSWGLCLLLLSDNLLLLLLLH